MLHNALVSLILLFSLSLDAVRYREGRAGFAAHYRPGLMDQVARRRGMPSVPCMVASPYYGLGAWVYVHSQKYAQTLHCRITDVPHPHHRPSIVRRNIVVEFDFNSARTMCRIQRYNQEPPQACPVIISPASAPK